MTSPFSWRPSITSREDWLESLGPATASAEEVLEGLVRELSPGARRVGGARWPWWLRVTDHEAICYQSVVLRFDKGPAPEPR